MACCWSVNFTVSFILGVRCATVIPFAPYGSAIIARTQKTLHPPLWPSVSHSHFTASRQSKTASMPSRTKTSSGALCAAIICRAICQTSLTPDFVARPADKTQRARAPEVPRLPAAWLLSYRHRADRKRSGCGGAAQPDGFLKQQLLRVQTSFLPFTQSIE